MSRRIVPESTGPPSPCQSCDIALLLSSGIDLAVTTHNQTTPPRPVSSHKYVARLQTLDLQLASDNHGNT